MSANYFAETSMLSLQRHGLRMFEELSFSGLKAIPRSQERGELLRTLVVP